MTGIIVFLVGCLIGIPLAGVDQASGIVLIVTCGAIGLIVTWQELS